MILLMYSGGLDSLGALYKLLTEKEYEQDEIHVHHIHISNIENRIVAEKYATINTLNWLRENNYRKFLYSESFISFPAYNRKFLFDSDITSFFSGYISSCTPQLRKVAVGVALHDKGSNLDSRLIRSNNIFHAFTDIEKIWPVGDMSKVEIYNMIPTELRKLSWSCRHPIYSKDSILSCHNCPTCKIFITNGLELNTINLNGSK